MRWPRDHFFFNARIATRCSGQKRTCGRMCDGAMLCVSSSVPSAGNLSSNSIPSSVTKELYTKNGSRSKYELRFLLLFLISNLTTLPFFFCTVWGRGMWTNFCSEASAWWSLPNPHRRTSPCLWSVRQEVLETKGPSTTHACPCFEKVHTQLPIITTMLNRWIHRTSFSCCSVPVVANTTQPAPIGSNENALQPQTASCVSSAAPPPYVLCFHDH